jgi:hypothetical protein
MNKPNYALHNAPYLINYDRSVAGKAPLPLRKT